VTLRQSKHAVHRLRVNASVQLQLADLLEPVEPVPIRRHQQVLHRRRVATLAVTGQRLRVDEPEKQLEDLRPHVDDLDARRVLLRHVAEELGAEDRRPGGEHDPVRRERTGAHLERDVRAHPVPEQAGEVRGELRRRDRVPGADDGEGAPDRERVVVDAPPREHAPMDEPVEAVALPRRGAEDLRPGPARHGRHAAVLVQHAEREPDHQLRVLVGVAEVQARPPGEERRAVIGYPALRLRQLRVEHDLPVVAAGAEGVGADVLADAQHLELRVLDHHEVVRRGRSLRHAPGGGLGGLTAGVGRDTRHARGTGMEGPAAERSGAALQIDLNSEVLLVDEA